MKLFCRTSHASLPAWYYGFVRHEDFAHTVLWAIVPFHLLARCGYMLQQAWWCFRWYGYGVDRIAQDHWMYKIRREAYEAGLADGEAGWQRSYHFRDHAPPIESWWP